MRGIERVRGAGTSNSSRTLDGECAGEEPYARSAPRRAPVSQIGTEESAPLWNGPRLRPAFVAQVLGQVMMDPRERASSLAPAAYRERRAQIPHGAFFNGNV